MGLIEDIKKRAISLHKHIVYPEGDDDRILQAAAQVLAEDIAELTILGDVDKIKWRAGELHIDISGAQLVNPANSEKKEHYAQTLYNLRRQKGMTLEEAREFVEDPIFFGTLMVHLGDADGMVSGARHTTADSIRPALQIIKTKPGHKVASSFFFMVPQDSDKVFFFADCAFIEHPNAHELATIAVQTADSARAFGFEPKVAMLSFSTNGSAHDSSLDFIIEATDLVRRKRPDIMIDGELQLDAAIVPEVAAMKCPDSPLKGDANVLVFPSLNAGNIGYKLVERFAHAKPIGPIIQGLNKPVNDLSRGCSVEQIVQTTEITVIEAKMK
ncbi:MAG: phosphate acetyltransferase [Nanoarchaeota archaeon]|nr:phosphate acetyltransferase [Nanoarchaeota archaeon]